jgi:hypothetical protein
MNFPDVTWQIIKDFAESRNISLQYLELPTQYEILGIDGAFELRCTLYKNVTDTTDLDDFETNFKPKGNRPLTDQATVQMARLQIITNENGLGAEVLKIPGTPGVLGTRIIKGGMGWFETPNAGDYVKVVVTDEDNILGYGAGVTIGSYTDADVPTENQGWFVPPNQFLYLERVGSTNGYLLGGLYIKIIVQTGDATQDVFRCNLVWGVNP